MPVNMERAEAWEAAAVDAEEAEAAEEAEEAEEAAEAAASAEVNAAESMIALLFFPRLELTKQVYFCRQPFNRFEPPLDGRLRRPKP